VPRARNRRSVPCPLVPIPSSLSRDAPFPHRAVVSWTSVAQPGVTRRLFATPAPRHQYAVTAGGQRFLMIVSEAPRLPITMGLTDGGVAALAEFPNMIGLI